MFSYLMNLSKIVMKKSEVDAIKNGTVTYETLKTLSSEAWLGLFDAEINYTAVEWVAWMGTAQIFQWMLSLLQEKQMISKAFFRIAAKEGWSGFHIVLRYQKEEEVIQFFKFFLSSANQSADKEGCVKELLRVQSNNGWSGLHLALLHQSREVILLIIRFIGVPAFQKEFERKNTRDKRRIQPHFSEPYKILLKNCPRGDWSGVQILHCNPHLKGATLESLLAAAQEPKKIAEEKQEEKQESENQKKHEQAVIPTQNEEKLNENSEVEKKECENAQVKTLSSQEVPSSENNADENKKEDEYEEKEWFSLKENDFEIVSSQPTSSHSLQPQTLLSAQQLPKVDVFCQLLQDFKEKNYQFKWQRYDKKNNTYLKLVLLYPKNDLSKNQAVLQKEIEQLVTGLKLSLSALFPKIVWGAIKKDQLTGGAAAIQSPQPSDDSIVLYAQDPKVIDQLVGWLVEDKPLEKGDAYSSNVDWVLL